MKLLYFNGRGLAETSRIILAYSKTSYEDFRYPIEVIDPINHVYKRELFEKDKAEGKFSVSMGKLPILITDSLVLSQSKAIERYLASVNGLMGSSIEESAKIDSICECVRDLKDHYMSLKKSVDFNEEEYFKTILPLKILELAKVMNNKGSPVQYSVGDKLSLADIVIFSFITDFFTNKEMAMKACSKSIKISSIVSNVGSIETIKEYLKTRAQTLF